MKSFTITFSGSVTLDETGFWPDDDAPKKPTRKDAWDVVDGYIESHGIAEFIQAWSLDDVLQVDVVKA